MENIFYVAVIVFSAVVSVWAVVMMVRTSPTFQDRRKNRRLEALVKQHEAARAR